MLNFKNELRRSVLYFVKKMPWVYQDRVHYFYKFKHLPNIREPKLFNEKVLYRKFINGDHLCYGRLSDKFLVRGYIANIIGDQYLIPLVHETSDPATLLNVASLRNTVIKSNHGSNMVEILLEEPDTEGRQRLVNRCQEWLKKDYSNEVREIHYRYIKPHILVERYIGDGESAAVDYKFHMFNKRDGNFEYVLQVIYNRGGPALSMQFYVNNLSKVFHRIRDTGLDMADKQDKLAKALELSKTLACAFDYVRVDWYIHGDQIYFGELTFTPGAGLVTGLEQGLDKIMGDMWIQDRTRVPQSDAKSEDISLPEMLKKV
ncbi:hypothetical protein PMPD1_4002 [Paramixta manurensis]|uniref:Uncharacterized protein n=1 Tax=Paramixta manurensis TaxID=2740817 RepID=A0A6M8UM84_9GAMM|nr:hypothetical protein PMPD1_4002 [Erwiniaceae bacterium PD-1]